MNRIRAGSIGLLLLTTAVVVFLLSPLVPVIASSFSTLDIVTFPPQGFTLKWYSNIPTTYWRSLSISLLVAGLTAIVVCLIGVPVTIALVRGNYPGRNFIRALLLSPLQVPLVVSGLVFMQFYFFVRNLTKLSLLGSVTGLTICHVILGLPFMIGALGPVLQEFHVSLEEAALSLGASPARTLRRVTLPVIAPGIFSGAMYAFISSFSDVAATLFLVSTKTMTLPVEIFYAMEFDLNPCVLAISTLVIMLCAAVVQVIFRFTGADFKGEVQRFG